MPFQSVVPKFRKGTCSLAVDKSQDLFRRDHLSLAGFIYHTKLTKSDYDLVYDTKLFTVMVIFGFVA